MQSALWRNTKKLFHVHQKLNNFLQHIIKIHATMSASVRYFNNRLNDYSGAAVQISKELFKSRCLDYAGHIFRHQTLSADDCDGGLYVGIAGVAYMSYYLSQHSEFVENRVEFLNKSEEYMKCALSYVEQPRIKADKSMQAAFLLGASGTYAVAAVIAKALGKETEYNSCLQTYAAFADICLPVNFLRCGSD
ncbi:LanC-like protein 3, partial [Stegodyphus mimosarum]